MAGRTKEHIQVGYYLSRFGNKKPPLRVVSINGKKYTIFSLTSSAMAEV